MFKRFIFNRLNLPERAERYRPRGTAQLTSIERQFPYLLHTTPKKTMNEKQRKKLQKKIERIAYWLDNAVPGSPIPLGIDSILGFIPFIGGFMGSLLSLYQVYLSTLFGIPLWLLMRMTISLFIDFIIGLVPVVGAFLDMFYKANLWNYEALEDYLVHESQVPHDNVPPPPSSSSSSGSKDTKMNPRYQDLASSEITWTQLGKDITQLGHTAMDYIPWSTKQHPE
ncbi:hypothetical protein O0I10_010478 [Lichtheimia ornata]|uniref:Uncharacterized protein n=1 Tax=Lichtheimia ornata TaxID=688661 RepID=A0AAD7UWP3_9FUNG|nr:uncharacterized protein O0I10_010478 [Lichtheimia ornata]KAJ8653910.1 hypothetical protein O0I10_010478 [Lichtheimia ornata]